MRGRCPARVFNYKSRWSEDSFLGFALAPPSEDRGRRLLGEVSDAVFSSGL